MLTPFEQVVALEVSELPPGRYQMNAGGVEAEFELLPQNLATDVQYIMAQQDVVLYSGPGTGHARIGNVAAGQIAKVTGVSADGAWWWVMCPDDTAGSCWLSTNPADTMPTEAPG